MRSLSKKSYQSGGDTARVIRRKNKRIPVEGVVGDIADGNFVFAGIVKDISSDGIKISQLPQEFHLTDQSYRTVITGDGNHYRILVRPCWLKTDRLSKTIEAGFKIIEASWEWEEFVIGQTPH